MPKDEKHLPPPPKKIETASFSSSNPHDYQANDDQQERNDELIEIENSFYGQ